MWTCAACLTEGNWASRAVCRRSNCDGKRGDALSVGGKRTGSDSSGRSKDRDDEIAVLKKANAALLKEQKSLKATIAAADSSAVADGEEAAKIARTREHITYLEKAPEEDGFAALLAAKRAELKALLDSKLESKPKATQLRELEERLAKKQKQLAAKKEEVEKWAAKHKQALLDQSQLEAEIADAKRQKSLVAVTVANEGATSPEERAGRMSALLDSARTLLDESHPLAAQWAKGISTMSTVAAQFAGGAASADAANAVVRGPEAVAVPPTQQYAQPTALILGDDDVGMDDVQGLTDAIAGADDVAKRKAAILGMVNTLVAKRHASSTAAASAAQSG